MAAMSSPANGLRRVRILADESAFLEAFGVERTPPPLTLHRPLFRERLPAEAKRNPVDEKNQNEPRPTDIVRTPAGMENGQLRVGPDAAQAGQSRKKIAVLTRHQILPVTA